MTAGVNRPNRSAASCSLRILETVALAGAGVTAREISQHLRIPSATAYRLLNQLVGDEYLVRTSDLRGFALGHAIKDLVTAANQPTISTSAREMLGDLRRHVRFAVHLVYFRNSSLTMVDCDPDHPLRGEWEFLRYLHASAAGKLMLSYDPDWRSAVPDGPLARLTPSTITDPAALDHQLAEIHRSQVAWEFDELGLDLTCMAVPLKLADASEAVAALYFSAPADRMHALAGHLEEARAAAGSLAPLLF